MTLRRRAAAARYAAPAAFLAAVTVAVLLIRAGLGGSGSTATTLGPVTEPSTRAVSTAVRTTTTEAARQPRVTYTVRSGDTFGSIAAQEGVPVAQIEQLNPGVSSNALRVGQTLRIK